MIVDSLLIYLSTHSLCTRVGSGRESREQLVAEECRGRGTHGEVAAFVVRCAEQDILLDACVEDERRLRRIRDAAPHTHLLRSTSTFSHHATDCARTRSVGKYHCHHESVRVLDTRNAVLDRYQVRAQDCGRIIVCHAMLLLPTVPLISTISPRIAWSNAVLPAATRPITQTNESCLTSSSIDWSTGGAWCCCPCCSPPTPNEQSQTHVNSDARFGKWLAAQEAEKEEAEAEEGVRVPVDIIGHARIIYVGKSHSCMV